MNQLDETFILLKEKIIDLELALSQSQQEIQLLKQAHQKEVADRKYVESELRTSQHMLQLVMDTLPEAIFWKDRNLELTSALHQLQQSQLQLIQREKMSALGNLVAGVAHEINNPVGFLAGNLLPAQEYIRDLWELIDLYQATFPIPGREIEEKSETIDLEYIREDLPNLLSSMEKGVERIMSISTSLRTFSRGDTESKVPFKIHEGLDSTLLILKHRLKANENRPAIQVITEYDESLCINCFPGQLNQVFMNLLANAIDALEESSQGKSFQEIQCHPNCIKILTELSPCQKFGVIRIQDNGVGMTQATQHKVFERLFTTKEVGKGTGLGLAIARQIIIEKHNGIIEINSALGEGSEFTIKIPLKTVY